MIKSFALTFVFWTLFIITNTLGDANRFYKGFYFYGQMRLWHALKFLWLFFALATGYCFNDLIEASNIGILGYGFLVVWFVVLRWILHEALMKKWRNYER